MVSEIVSFVYLLIDSMGLLILSAIGLMIIFGMMGVINMAHGELMMIGAYITASLYHLGVPSPVGIACGGVGAAGIGVLLERTIIRHFYNQLLSSLVVTWGLALIISHGMLNLFGSSIRGVATPLGNFAVAGSSYSYYNLVIFGVATLLVACTWALFRFTRFGVRVRATMEDVEMAEALGVRASWIYAATFALGSFYAGIAGGMLALTSSITPFFGQDYTAMAFVTVVVGGAANVLSGIIASPLFLSVVNTIGTVLVHPYVGYIAMMAGALLILIWLPSGISNWLEARRLRT
jgi:branched-chain amino acid transport system permease protein